MSEDEWDLRNHGGRVLERVVGGETLTVTRSGRAVAELRPLPVRGLRAEALLARWRALPHVDPRALRTDIDAVLEATI
jgi:antitoxin (DNA-binding transcriptional repressor) of toxin-antitoxin stability system